MNLFHVLSQGKSRIHENSTSAFLGYLLSSKEDHGLGEAFIRIFLSSIDTDYFNDILNMDKIDSSCYLEEPYQFKNKRYDIDIQINLKGPGNKEITLIIENKIKPGAANDNQLENYYQAILDDDKDNKKNIYFIFLTPFLSRSKFTKEFENLTYNNKRWVFWNKEGEQSSISFLLNSILDSENQGMINPINEYMRHTLKAFLRHIRITIDNNEKRTNRVGHDLGEIIDEVDITLKNGDVYTVIKRDSTQIQVFNKKNSEKEVARYIMAQYIDENEINIKHEELNTRSIGKKLIEYLKEKNK